MSFYRPIASVALSVGWEDFIPNSPSIRVQHMNVLAKSVSIELNSYEEADTFRLELDYKNFPFDPRVIRSVQVSIFLDDHTLYDPKKFSTNSFVPDKRDAIFLGFADEAGINLSDDRTVEMSGRDFTAIFLNRTSDITDPLSLEGKLDIVLKKLIERIESARELTFETRGLASNDIPTLAAIRGDVSSDLSGKRNPKKNETYWDMMVSIVREAGLICFIDRDKFVLTKPRNLYTTNQKTQMVYGYNIEDLKFNRKIGRQKAQNVRVSGWYEKRKITRELPKDALSPGFIALFGKSEITVEKYGANGEKLPEREKAEIIPFPVGKVSDPKHLILLGESIYEQIIWQHLTGSMKTRDMSFRKTSIGRTLPGQTRPERVDLGISSYRDLRIGGAIEIIIAVDDLDKIKSIADFKERVAYLLSRGYPREIAEEFARSLSKQSYDFYIRSIQFMLSDSNGFTIDIDFINFIDLKNKIFGGSFNQGVGELRRLEAGRTV